MSTQTVTQVVPAGTYAVDPIHSTIHFAVTHSEVATFRSGFKEYEAPQLTGSVEVASIDIEEEQFKGHLLSPEFFDVENNPRLKFSSTELSVDDEGQVRLAGELEIRGQTHEVNAVGRFASVPAYLDGRERIGLSVETRVDRREFGLNWNADLPSGGQALDYEVEIAVELEFVAEAE
jgi:polyisoprenoid-binding protein YceI